MVDVIQKNAWNLATVCVAAAVALAVMQWRVGAVEVRVDRLAGKAEVAQSDLAEIKADIRWIKIYLSSNSNKKE